MVFVTYFVWIPYNGICLTKNLKKMKKVTYLFVLMFSLVLMSTSCEKDPITPDNPSTGITRADLNGNWKFQKFEYAGILSFTTATSCADVATGTTNVLGKPARWVKLSLNIDDLGCDLIDACDNPVYDNTLTFDAATNKITLDNGIVFQIMFYDKATKILRLKLLAPVSNTDSVLEGSVYTFQI
jgi:hypothetical protein